MEVNEKEAEDLLELMNQDFTQLAVNGLYQQGARIAGFKSKAAAPALDLDLDPRVREVLHRIEIEQETFPSLTSIAATMDLSMSRLVHLISESLGVPFRTYLLWLKLRRGTEGIVKGQNLTKAAHRAGFSDSAHFSRVFSRTFGFSPSFLKLVRVENFE